MKRTGVELTPAEALNLVEFLCDCMVFASKEENIIRWAEDRRYQDMEHYLGSKLKKELLDLKLVIPGDENKLDVK